MPTNNTDPQIRESSTHKAGGPALIILSAGVATYWTTTVTVINENQEKVLRICRPLSVGLFLCLYTSIFTLVSICLCLHVYLSIYLSSYLCLSLSISIYISIPLNPYISISLSISPLPLCQTFTMECVVAEISHQSTHNGVEALCREKYWVLE